MKHEFEIFQLTGTNKGKWEVIASFNDASDAIGFGKNKKLYSWRVVETFTRKVIRSDFKRSEIEYTGFNNFTTN